MSKNFRFEFAKLGDLFYKFNGFDLVEHEGEAPEEFVDLTEDATAAQGMSFDELRELVTKTKEDFNAKTAEAKEKTTPEALAAQVEVQNKLTVLSRELDVKRELQAILDESDVDKINTDPAKESEGEGSEDGEPAKEGEGEPAKEGEEGTEGEGDKSGETDGDTGSEDGEGENPDAGTASSAEIMALQEQINALTSQSPELVAASRNVNITSGGIVIDRQSGKESQFDDAEFSTASGDVLADIVDVDKYLSTESKKLKSDAGKLQSGQQGAVVTLGSFKMFDGPMAVDEGGEKVNEYFTRGPHKEINEAILASRDDQCDNVARRRNIPNCDRNIVNLADKFQVFAAPECSAEFYKDIPLEDFKDGIEVWDEAKKEALCAAEDAVKEAIEAGDAAALVEAEAAVKLASKNNCREIGCLEKAKTNPMQAVIACQGWSIERQDCSPESIAVARRKLSQMFLKVWNSMILKQINDLTSKTVTVDNDDYVNADGFKYDVCHVLDIALAKLEAASTFLQDNADADYMMIIPQGLRSIMEAGSRVSAYAFENEFANKFSRFEICEVTEIAATEDDLCPAPTGFVFPEGDDCDIADFVLPTSYQIQIVNRDSYFAMARPDVEYQAQITAASVKKNRYADEFLESFISLNKDGCTLDYTIDLNNPCANGAKTGLIAPTACLNTF